jgi:hypothetical protein
MLNRIEYLRVFAIVLMLLIVGTEVTSAPEGDGKVKIHFYLNPNGNINSFFPSIAPL